MDDKGNSHAPTVQKKSHFGDGTSKKGLAARLMEIARETAPQINDGRTLKEIMDEPYDDETGLPK
jgi:hypothetical protein